MLNPKLIKNQNISFSQKKIKRPLSTQENINTYIKEKNKISHILAKYENTQGLSTKMYTLHTDFKTENETAIT